MSPPETLVGRVGVELGVGVSVMSPVTTGPPLDGSLDGASASHGKSDLKRSRGVVRSVSPQSVVAGSDTQSGDVVVDNRPNDRVAVVRCRQHSVNRDRGGYGDGQERDPLDVVDQVFPSDWWEVLLLGDRRRDIVVGNVNVGRGIGGFDGVDPGNTFGSAKSCS